MNSVKEEFKSKKEELLKVGHDYYFNLGKSLPYLSPSSSDDCWVALASYLVTSIVSKFGDETIGLSGSFSMVRIDNMRIFYKRFLENTVQVIGRNNTTKNKAREMFLEIFAELKEEWEQEESK